jgi:hypothetical protein
MERDKLVIIIMLAADILLVLTMFLGLLRLRDRAGGLFGLARLLWKQVRSCHFLRVVVISIP